MNPILTGLKGIRSSRASWNPRVESSWIWWLRCSHWDPELLIPWFFFLCWIWTWVPHGTPEPPDLHYVSYWQSHQKSSFYFTLPSAVSELSLTDWMDHASIAGAEWRFWLPSSHRDWEWREVILNNAGAWMLVRMKVISCVLQTTDVHSMSSLCLRKYSLFVGLPTIT